MATVARYMETYFTDLVKGVQRDFLIGGKSPSRVVPTDQIKSTIEKYLPFFSTMITRYTDWLMDGSIDAVVWGRYIKNQIAQLYLTVGAVSVGHAGKLTKEDIKTIDDKLREQYKYLDRFVITLRHSDLEEFSKQYVINRVGLYLGGSAEVMDRLRDRSEDKPDLPFYPRDGDTLCMIHCQCRWEWVNVNPQEGDWDVYWVMDHDYENCDTCKARALACSPLQIRGTKIITNVNLNDLIVRR